MRYERKYSFNYFDYHLLQSQLIASGFALHYPKRIVSSIYFDTLDFKLFHSSQYGLKDRAKIRYRWYSNDINPKMENKIKRDELSYKNNFISEIDLKDKILVNHLCPISRKYNDFKIPRVIRQIYFPAISITYERDYYVSNCGKCRVTLDSNIYFSKIINFGDYLKISNWNPAPNSVLEIKYEFNLKDAADMIGSVLKNTNLCLSRNSKYCQGIIQLNN